MSAIGQVTAHFKRFSGDGRTYVDVPEWGEEKDVNGEKIVVPLRIYWKPITGAETRQARRDKDGGEVDLAKLLVIKAEDAAGEKLFDIMTDVPTLSKHADWAVVTRIALRMMMTPKIEDLTKN